MVKTLRVMNNRVWLLPQNPTYEPISGDACQITWNGVVCTVVPQVIPGAARKSRRPATQTICTAAVSSAVFTARTCGPGTQLPG